LDGAFERAWHALELLKEYDPKHGGQVHVISVLMQENQNDMESLLQLSKAAGVGHQFTLVSSSGYRRANGATSPDAHIPVQLAELRGRYPHLRSMRNYVDNMGRFLSEQSLPVCNAGQQSFNVDHLGDVSPCIEKIDQRYGNIAVQPLSEILQRMQDLNEVRHCQDCWTLCRGMAQSFRDRGSLRDWNDLMQRRHAV
jgi:radical SAM protein with 4Fe4S-binding SPASM domain